MDAPPSPRHRCGNEIPNAEDKSTATNCSRPIPEVENCASDEGRWALRRCTNKTLTKRKASPDASEATSSFSSASSAQKSKRKGIACKRRNPRVAVGRRNRGGDVAAIGLPLGMSFAAVMAQVLYRRDAAAESISPNHISSMCTSAVKESLANVFGDKLDGLTRSFEQSFGSTLSTLRLIYESSTSNEGDKLNNIKLEIPNSKLTIDKADCSSDGIIEDGYLGSVSHTEVQGQSISHEEVKENFHMDSVSHHMDSIGRDLTLYRQQNQMVCFSPTSSGSEFNNPMVSTFEKSVVEQSRSNDLKEIELGLTMKKLKLKETQLVLNFDLNNLERSKASFRHEKFKNQLEDTRHGELSRKCIDCLIAGLIVMSSSLLYGAYVYSYERITEATGSCTPSTEESSSWWTPKPVVFLNSRLTILWCQVQIMSRMMFGVLMIIAIAYLLIQRSTSSQTMPVTFILLMLGVGCGYCGKLCVDTLGGSGYVWLLYWEILCLLHFLCIGCTSILYQILYGPVTAALTSKENTKFRYWIRRFLFYATLLVFLPLFCGLMPFASLGQWKDHVLLKVSYFSGLEW